MLAVADTFCGKVVSQLSNVHLFVNTCDISLWMRFPDRFLHFSTFEDQNTVPLVSKGPGFWSSKVENMTSSLGSIAMKQIESKRSVQCADFDPLRTVELNRHYTNRTTADTQIEHRQMLMFNLGIINPSLGVLTVLIFDPFLIHFFHFCRHRPSKMK